MYATLWLLLLCTTMLPQTPPAPAEPEIELRAALDELRRGDAQSPEFAAAAERLPELLASGAGFFVEGAAFVAGQHARKECVPALIAALEHENRRAPDGSDEPTRCLLDALIRLDARVPADVILARVEPQFAPQAHLLMAKGEKPDLDGLLRLYELGWTDLLAHWASACKLVAARDPRILHSLLFATPWEVEFAVCDDGNDYVARGMSSGVACSRHPRWPPRVLYELQLPDAQGSSLEVGFKRSQFTTCWWNHGLSRAYEPAAQRMKLVELALGEATPDLRPRLAPPLLYTYSDDASCLEALDVCADGAFLALEAVARRAVEKQLFSEEQRALPPFRLQINLRDCRVDPAAPLPKPPPRANVEFRGD